MKILTSVAEFSAAINKENLTIIDFYADWCGPCKMIAPDFEYLSQTYLNVNFVKVDVDKAQDIAQICGVQSMPTFLFYRAGENLAKVVGADIESISSKLILFGGNISPEEEKLTDVVTDLLTNSSSVFSLLKSVMLNVVNFPEETKFQKIKTTNPKVQALLAKDALYILNRAGWVLVDEYLILKDANKCKTTVGEVKNIENRLQKDFKFDSDNSECFFSNYFEMSVKINGRYYPSVSEYLKSNSKDLANAVKAKFTGSKFLLEELLKKKKQIICNGDPELGKVLTQIRDSFLH